MAAPIVAIHYRPLVSGYAQGRLWATSINTSDDGTETRKALNTSAPIRSVAMSWTMGRPAAMAAIEQAIYKGISDKVGIPLWWSACALTAPVVSGSTIPCVTANADFTLGQYAMIVDVGETRYAIVTVTAINANSIGISETAVSWVTGDFIVPLIDAKPLLGTASQSWRSELSMSGSARFVEL